jgi:hypothetical protein
MEISRPQPAKFPACAKCGGAQAGVPFQLRVTVEQKSIDYRCEKCGACWSVSTSESASAKHCA